MCSMPLTSAGAPRKKANAERTPGARGEGVDRAEPEHERQRRGERVLAEADARLAMEERVVERMQQGDGGRGAEDDDLQ